MLHHPVSNQTREPPKIQDLVYFSDFTVKNLGFWAVVTLFRFRQNEKSLEKLFEPFLILVSYIFTYVEPILSLRPFSPFIPNTSDRKPNTIASNAILHQSPLKNKLVPQ